MTRLVDDLEGIPKRMLGSKRVVSGKVRVFRFKAGQNVVSHPALIL